MTESAMSVGLPRRGFRSRLKLPKSEFNVSLKASELALRGPCQAEAGCSAAAALGEACAKHPGS